MPVPQGTQLPLKRQKPVANPPAVGKLKAEISLPTPVSGPGATGLLPKKVPLIGPLRNRSR